MNIYRWLPLYRMFGLSNKEREDASFRGEQLEHKRQLNREACARYYQKHKNDKKLWSTKLALEKLEKHGKEKTEPEFAGY